MAALERWILTMFLLLVHHRHIHFGKRCSVVEPFHMQQPVSKILDCNEEQATALLHKTVSKWQDNAAGVSRRGAAPVAQGEYVKCTMSLVGVSNVAALHDVHVMYV